MAHKILVFRVGDFRFGINFDRIEHIVDLPARQSVGGSDAAENGKISEKAETDAADLRKIFGIDSTTAANAFLEDKEGRVFAADEVLEITECAPEDILPIPPYVFEGEKFFRGIFSYRDGWALWLNEDLPVYGGRIERRECI